MHLINNIDICPTIKLLLGKNIGKYYLLNSVGPNFTITQMYVFIYFRQLILFILLIWLNFFLCLTVMIPKFYSKPLEPPSLVKFRKSKYRFFKSWNSQKSLSIYKLIHLHQDLNLNLLHYAIAAIAAKNWGCLPFPKKLRSSSNCELTWSTFTEICWKINFPGGWVCAGLTEN